ncbi:cytochrome c1 [Vibrio stylophorae]|nr:cytochrome c1 [Vibrio stylophorae]
MLALSFSVGTAMAAGGSAIPLMSANTDLTDTASLQRGAQLYTNFCFGCHSMQYQRYNRVAQDLNIPEDLMVEHLIFDPNAKVGDLMINAMPENYAKAWFGAAPPDLTLVARVRGADWLYTYLQSFYADPNRPFGSNNLLYPNVGMPHVLETLQGISTPIYEIVIDENGQSKQVIVGLESDGLGELNAQEYQQAVRDLVNFLQYSGEPIQVKRQQIGYWVIAFLVLFLIFAFLLKKEYWRDVH